MTGPAVDRAAWQRAAVRAVPGSTARLVIGQLADRASRTGHTRATVGVTGTLADVAAGCALPVTAVADVLADLASRGLLGRDRRHLVLVTPDADP